eukprot:m51a1_g2291 hypothetical protein (322) ;mRNA; r:412577-413765
MDPILVAIIATALTGVLGFALFLYLARDRSPVAAAAAAAPDAAKPPRGLNRMQRRGAPAAPAAAAAAAPAWPDQRPEDSSEDESGEESDGDDGMGADEEAEAKESRTRDRAVGRTTRRGTKYEEKMRRKEERRAMNKEMAAMREQKKAEDEAKEAEEKEKRAKEEEEQRKEEEAEKERLRQKEQRELEEYNEWKSLIETETKGTHQDDAAALEARTREFLDFVKTSKVVRLEELGAEFGIKAAEAAEKIRALEREGKLTGLLDDRGTYIYVTEDEMKAVAKVIERRGRISIDEIVAEANRIIDLNPVAKPEPADVQPEEQQ